MAYYANETPSGTINGVNATFTTAHTLYTAIIVVVDGLIYTGGITYTGADTSFTLADAPVYSITISYYDTVVPSSSSGGSTDLSDITDEFYAIVNQDTSSTVYPGSDSGGTYVENLANLVQDTICRMRKWWFLKKKQMFNTAVATTTSAAITTVSTSTTIAATTGWPTTVTNDNYALLIEGDVINFTGRSGSTLNGLTNIDVGHVSGSKIELLYALPTDFAEEPKLFVKTTNSDRFVAYKKVDEDDDDIDSYENYFPGSFSKRFSIVTDKNGNEYMRIADQTASNIAMLRYFKRATTMTSTYGSTIPEPFAMKILPRTMAGIAMMERGDNPDNLANAIQEIAKDELKEMKNYHNRREAQKRPKVDSIYRSGISDLSYNRSSRII